MKRLLVIAVFTIPFLMTACNSLPGSASKPVVLKNSSDSLSYALGLDIGKSIKDLKAPVNLDAFGKGVADVVKGNTQMIADSQATAIKQEFFMKAQQAKMAESQAKGEANSKAGEAFLVENGKKPGIKTTASGLQYQVITEGTGPMPKATDKVKVHYVGTLLDGKEFDSSRKRGEPVVFPLNGVIPGWTEGVQLMKVGGKIKFFVPAKLAYGERGAGADIGPNSTLIFEIELLGIEK
jgi:FKBP-type peptidyl-prolyl cis-trans isomerase FkpA